MMRQINSEQKLITARISQRVVLFSLAADCAMEVTPLGVISLVLVAGSQLSSLFCNSVTLFNMFVTE